MAAPPAVIGIDVGTLGVRAAAFTTAGRLVAIASSARPPRIPAPDAMVHEPEADWWGGCAEALLQVSRAAGDYRIQAVGLSGLFPAAALLDRAGCPLGDALLYGDGRAKDDVTAVEKMLATTLTGDEVTPRLVWRRRTTPEVMARTELLLGPAGYVGLRLTGQAALDPHSAVRWGGVARGNGRGWDWTAIDRLGLPRSIFPPVVAPTSVLGGVTRRAAAATGLRTGTPVVVGCTDSFAGLLGQGARHIGDALVYYGSTGTLMVCTADLGDALADTGLFAAHSPYRLVAYVPNSGSFLDDARREMLGGAARSRLDRLAAAVPPGADGVSAFPYPAGRLLPEPVPGARAAIVGLALRHGAGHIWRALLESFGHVLIEAQQQLPDDPGVVVAGGGGARSAVWRQIVSDMTGWPQRAPSPEGSVRGAALIAALGAGLVSDTRAAGPAWIAHSGRSVRPDPSAQAIYRRLHDVWRRFDTVLTGRTDPEAPGERVREAGAPAQGGRRPRGGRAARAVTGGALRGVRGDHDREAGAPPQAATPP